MPPAGGGGPHSEIRRSRPGAVLDAEAPAAEEPPPSRWGGIPVAGCRGRRRRGSFSRSPRSSSRSGSGGGSLVIAGGEPFAERIGRRRSLFWPGVSELKVEIVGAVTRPGVYRLPGRHPDRRPGRCRRWLQPQVRRRSCQSRPEPRGTARRQPAGARFHLGTMKRQSARPVPARHRRRKGGGRVGRPRGREHRDGVGARRAARASGRRPRAEDHRRARGDGRSRRSTTGAQGAEEGPRGRDVREAARPRHGALRCRRAAGSRSARSSPRSAARIRTAPPSASPCWRRAPWPRPRPDAASGRRPRCVFCRQRSSPWPVGVGALRDPPFLILPAPPPGGRCSTRTETDRGSPSLSTGESSDGEPGSPR